MEWNDQLIDEALRASSASLEKKYPAGLPPAQDLWTAIGSKKKAGRIIRMRVNWTVAATILLLVTAIAIGIAVKKEKALPVVHQPLPTQPMPATENEATEYIRQLCINNNIACQSAAFRELQLEMDSASLQLIAINQKIKLFGDDEHFFRAKTRIENHQARIVKAMLKIL